MTTKLKTRITNQLQARHLTQRLNDKQRLMRNEIYALVKDRKAPAAINQAREMVKRWDKSEYNFKQLVQRQAMKKLDDAAKRAQEQILFAAPADALKAVQEFERFSVK